MTLADFLSNQLQMTEEQFDEQCPAVIKQSMIQELLLKAVAESENMEISDEEYEAGIEKYMESTGAESKETLLANYTEAEIRRSLIMDKALDFLKENTTVKVEGEDETEASSEAESTSETEAASEAETETEAASETAAETETPLRLRAKPQQSKRDEKCPAAKALRGVFIGRYYDDPRIRSQRDREDLPGRNDRRFSRRRN